MQTFSPSAARFNCSYLRTSDATRHRCHSTATAAHLLISASPALMAKIQVSWATTLYPVFVGRVVPNLLKDHDAHIFGVKQSRRRLLGREIEIPRRDHSATSQKIWSSAAPLREAFVTRLLNYRYVHHDFELSTLYNVLLPTAYFPRFQNGTVTTQVCIRNIVRFGIQLSGNSWC